MNVSVTLTKKHTQTNENEMKQIYLQNKTLNEI